MKKRAVSLKWQLVLAVVLCCVLPVVVFVAFTTYQVSQNVNNEIENTVKISFDNAVSMSDANLKAAFSDSREASYDPIIYNAYKQYGEDGDLVALHSQVQGFLNRKYRYEDNFTETMFFFTEDPDDIYAVSNAKYGGLGGRLKNYRENVQHEVLDLTEEAGTEIIFFENGGDAYMLRNLVDSKYVPYATIVMKLDPPFVFKGILGMPWANGVAVWLDDIKVSLEGDIPAPPEMEGGVAVLGEENGDYVIYENKNIENRVILYAARMSSAAMNGQFEIVYSILILGAVLAALILIFIFIFYRSVTRPVESLAVAMGRIGKGELGYRITGAPKSKEALYLEDTFNAMSAGLKQMFEKNTEENLGLVRAREYAMHNGISPNFMRDTLEQINWEAKTEGASRVAGMIEALSHILSAEKEGNKARAPLSEELKYLDSYLAIISARLGKRLAVKKEIDEKLLDREVPSLIMQPLVENAVEYGVMPQQHGEIILRAYARGEDLILEVENDRPLSGEDKEATGRIIKGGEDSAGEDRQGIRTSVQRLEQIYGERARFSVTSGTDGERTVARIEIMGGAAPV